MYVLTRSSTLARLQLMPGGLARLQNDCVTLLPVSTTQETGLSVEPLSGGGYGVILRAGDTEIVVAQYPTPRLARRQLRRLAREGDSGWSSWLGRGVVTAGLLFIIWFIIWFLFFLPGDPSNRAAAWSGEGRAALPAALVDPAEAAVAAGRPPVPPVVDGPAYIDDPAVRGSNPPTTSTGLEPVLAR